MKIALSLAALAVMTVSSFAHASIAATGYASLNETVYLQGCGGTMSFNNGADDNQLNVVFSGVKHCSNFDIIGEDNSYVSDYRVKKLEGSNTDRYGSFTIPGEYIRLGSNTVTVIVRSNSGAHSDTIKVRYNKKYTVTVDTNATYLPSCGGAVWVSNGTYDNEVSLTFVNVVNCSNFDLLSDDGRYVADYNNRKLMGTPGNMRGTFTIPSSHVHYGTNTLKATVYSNSHAHETTVNVTYTAGYKIQ